MSRCVKCGEPVADAAPEEGQPGDTGEETPITRGTSRTRGGDESDLHWCENCGEWVESGDQAGASDDASGDDTEPDDDDRVTRGTSRTR